MSADNTTSTKNRRFSILISRNYINYFFSFKLLRRWNMIIWVNVVQNGTVVDSDWCIDNLRNGHFQTHFDSKVDSTEVVMSKHQSPSTTVLFRTSLTHTDDHIPPTNEMPSGFKPTIHVVHELYWLLITTCKQDPQEFPTTIEKQYIDHIKKVKMPCCFVYYKINES